MLCLGNQRAVACQRQPRACHRLWLAVVGHSMRGLPSLATIRAEGVVLRLAVVRQPSVRRVCIVRRQICHRQIVSMLC
jgi:hypothetical protein